MPIPIWLFLLKDKGNMYWSQMKLTTYEVDGTCLVHEAWIIICFDVT